MSGLTIACVVLCAACATGRLTVARALVAHNDRQPGLVEVPYVAQSILLCGGAAIAMIERFWGRRGVFAEDFASLVHPDVGGMLTTDMVLTLRSRGWDTQALTSTMPSRMQASIADSIPVVALIRVAKNRYHYVIVIGWTADAVTYHDPAVAPAVRRTLAEFMQRWAGANQWAMFVQPMPAKATAVVPPSPRVHALPDDSLPCRPWLDRAADAASENRLDDADQFLSTAVRECPSEAVVLRELAGVRFRQGKQAEATHLAAAYTRRAPNDSLGWQLLASTRYLTGDDDAALQAWNAIGRPTIDLLRIDGTRHIRFRVLASHIGTSPGTILTPPRLALAQRRIADIPSLEGTRVAYAAVSGGTVEVRAVVTEHSRVDPLPQLLVVGAVRAAVRRDAALVVSTPFGAGERWTALWRWEAADPAVVLRLEIPATIGIPGIVTLARSWETYRYTAGTADERRRTSSASFDAWIRPDLEQRTGVRYERWSGHGDFVALSVAGSLHKAHDAVSVLAHVEHAIPLGGNASYDRVRVRTDWTLPSGRWRNSWSMHVGTDWNSAFAPRGLWAIAGGNLSREIPLRAHPFIVDRVLPTARVGRAITHGGIAGDRPVARVGPITLAVGIFVDGAHVLSLGSRTTPTRLYLDGGAGLRIGSKAARSPSLRLDVARGLVADRRWGVTMGIEPLRLVRLRP